MKLDNIQVLIAFVLSILVHASAAVLGNYQWGKIVNKTGSLSVSVVIQPTNNATQVLSKPLLKLATESESLSTTNTVLKDRLEDKLVAPVTAEATVIEKKATETFTTKPAGKITHKHVVATKANSKYDRPVLVTKANNHPAQQSALFSATDRYPQYLQAEKKPPPTTEKLMNNQLRPGEETTDEGLVSASIPVVSAIPLYHLNPKPHYPERSRDLGEEGTVIIAIKVSVDGDVARAYVSKTSGYALLDGSALSTVRSQWRFRPATRAGKPVESWVRVPVRFNIRKR